jgi:hypothetical protein
MSPPEDENVRAAGDFTYFLLLLPSLDFWARQGKVDCTTRLPK